MRIGVVTDSSSDLPPSVFGQADVISVPLDVRLGDRDPAELRLLTGDEFWQLVQKSNELPTTAAPAPGAFQQAFNDLFEQGCTGVVCINISGELSGTYRSAVLGAAECVDHVSVIDSRNATMGQGLLVLEALATRDQATDLESFVEHLETVREKIFTFGTLNTLENLRRGGRIGAAQAFFGSLLSIKPIVEVRHGHVEGESKQRTRSRSLNYLADKVKDAGPLARLAVIHALADDLMDFVQLLDGVEVDEEIIISSMGPVIGAHTGVGTIGVAFQKH